MLIPQEFSLVLTAPGGKKSREQTASVFASVDIPKGKLLHPFQGTVRIDKLRIFSHLHENDVSSDPLKRNFYFHLQNVVTAESRIFKLCQNFECACVFILFS